MIDRGTRNTSGQRSEILRGIYDENRRLHGAEPPPPPKKRPASRPAGGRLMLLMLLTAVPLVYAWAPQGSELLALLAPTRVVEGGAALPSGHASLMASFTPSPAAPPATLAEAAPAGTQFSPRAEAAVPSVDATASVAPLASGAVNLKSLFGLSVRNIVIDAGHGGHDPGAIGKNGAKEKDITLDVALRLKAKLAENPAYRIRLVRDDDVFVPLNERADFANGRQTDLFVSIHVNYLPSTSTNAVETYYFGHHQDARTRKLAERENQGSEYSLSEFENVMRNVQDTIKLQESKALAHSIQGSLLKSIRARSQRVLDNGVRTAPFVVLLGVKAPSVLVEIGSLSSPEAEQSLGRERYRDQIASYVAAGINHYLNEQLPEERRIHDKNQDRLAKRE